MVKHSPNERLRLLQHQQQQRIMANNGQVAGDMPALEDLNTDLHPSVRPSDVPLKSGLLPKPKTARHCLPLFIPMSTLAVVVHMAIKSSWMMTGATT